MNFDSIRSLPGAERRRALNPQADIPRLVRELRERTGLTQEKFAAKLGVTFPTINRWENGRAKPSPLALKQIEDLLRDLGEKGRDLLEEFFGEEE
jgi:transcriptional regulator with XRE-family HTH domain